MTIEECRLKSERASSSLVGFFLWHPSIAGVRLALWDIAEHHKHHIPPRLRELLRHVAFLIARPRARDLRHLKEILEHRIMILAIELTNICNANCRFCAYRHQRRPKGVMSSELFEYAIHQYAEAGGGILNLTPIVGDPLVDASLVSRIKFAKQIKQITSIFLYTNLIGLDSFDPRDVLSSGLDRINISTSIGSKETYARTFGVDRYDSVMRNLETLLGENRRLNDPVKVTVHVRADKTHDQITSSPVYRRIRRQYGRAVCHIDDQYDNWTGLIEEDDLPHHHAFPHLENMSEPCAELYNGMIVFLNGDVGICWRRDLEAKLVVGNMRDSSLKDIWRGERVRTIREQWVEGNIPTICRKCYCYTPLSRFMVYSGSRILSMQQVR